VLARYAVPGVLAELLFSATALLIVVGATVVLVTRWRLPIDVARSPRWIIAGRQLRASASVHPTSR
jgi:hypothetical protein